MIRRLLIVLTAISLFSSVAMAQVSTGSLSGTVTDPNGASVPSAKVSVTGTENGFKEETVTSEAGLYVFPRLPVGRYEVAAEQSGFKKLMRSGVEIRVATRQELDLRLDVGDVQQTVEVTGEVPLLETNSAMRGSSLSP